jgi:hypothetical protein
MRRTIADVVLLFTDKFPSSAAFDAINDALTSSDASRRDAIRQGNAVFAFTLKNEAGETESWHIDLKNKGEVAKGLGEKPNGKTVSATRPTGTQRPVSTARLCGSVC